MNPLPSSAEQTHQMLPFTSRQVCLALSPAKGGDLEASLDEVILRLARSKLDHGYASAREALLINAKLVIAQVGGVGRRCWCGAVRRRAQILHFTL